MILHHLLILLIINYCVATSPTNGYVPGPVSCPSSQLIRSDLRGSIQMNNHISMPDILLPNKHCLSFYTMQTYKTLMLIRS